MSRKGISPVIASILLILVVISLAGGFVVFSDRIASETTGAVEEQAASARALTATQFSITDVSGQEVSLRNIGTETIEPQSLRVTMDGQVLNYSMSGAIDPEERGTLALDGLWRFGPGERSLRVAGASKTDSMRVDIRPADGRVLDMRFEEGGGDTIFDLSGNGNDGEMRPNASAGPSWTEGVLGGALSFDGIGFVEVPHDESLEVTNMITMEVWVKTDLEAGRTGGDYQYVIRKRKDPGSSYESESYTMFIHINSNVFRTNMHNGTNEIDCATDVAVAEAGEWYHWVATYDGNEIKNYINGVDEPSSYTVDGTVQGDDCPFAGSLDISPIELLIAAFSQGGRELEGDIDDVRIYSRALTPDELYVMK